MELFEAIEKRHSYRKDFTDKSVPRKDLKKIVQAGLMAPSGCNAQTTQFVIVDDAAVLEKMRGLISDRKPINQCKALIACVVDKNPAPVYGTTHFQIEDCAAAVQNMLLAISALGYATVWLDGALRHENRAEKFAEIMKLPPEKKVQIVLPIGVPKEPVAGPEKLPFEKRAFFNQHGKGE